MPNQHTVRNNPDLWALVRYPAVMTALENWLNNAPAGEIRSISSACRAVGKYSSFFHEMGERAAANKRKGVVGVSVEVLDKFLALTGADRLAILADPAIHTVKVSEPDDPGVVVSGKRGRGRSGVGAPADSGVGARPAVPVVADDPADDITDMVDLDDDDPDDDSATPAPLHNGGPATPVRHSDPDDVATPVRSIGGPRPRRLTDPVAESAPLAGGCGSPAAQPTEPNHVDDPPGTPADHSWPGEPDIRPPAPATEAAIADAHADRPAIGDPESPDDQPGIAPPLTYRVQIDLPDPPARQDPLRALSDLVAEIAAGSNRVSSIRITLDVALQG